MPFPITGGVNLLNDSRSIRDDQCVRAQNLIPTKPGIIGKRPGMTFGVQVLRTTATALDTAVANGSVVWNTIPIPFEGNLAFVGWIDAALQPSGSVGTALVATGPDNQSATYSVVPGGVRAKRRPALVAFNNKIYAFAGYPDVFNKVIQSTSTGFEIANFAFSGSGNTSLSPRVAGVYKNRMVYANFGPGYENHLVFSDRYEPQVVGDSVLAANGRNIIVGARDGDRIIAVHEISTSGAGSPSQSILLVLKEFSGYIIAGEPNESDDTFGSYLNTLEVNKLNVQTGCVSPATIADTPFGTVWCGADDVWLMPPGGVPYQIGTHLRPLIKNQSRAVQYKLFGAYFDGFYRLALFGEGQGPSDDSAPAEHWWLDLREGAPRNYTEARWWGPQIYKPVDYFSAGFGDFQDDRYQNPTQGPWAFILENRPGRDKQLYFVTDGFADAKRFSSVTNRALVLAPLDSNRPYDVSSHICQMGPTWSSLSSYAVGDITVQIGSLGLPREFVVTTAGTSGSSQPDWTAVVTTVADGTVTWTLKTLALLDRINEQNEVTIDLITKEYESPEPFLDKLIDGLELDILVSTMSRLKIGMIVNGGASSTYTNEDLPRAGWGLGSSLLGASPLSRQFQTVAVNPADGARVFGKTIQYRIQDVPGWLIDSTNNTVRFVHNSQGAKTAVLTSGYYESLPILLAELTTQMNAQMSGGVTFSHNTWTASDLDEQLAKITCSSGTFYFDILTATTAAFVNIIGFNPSVEQTTLATQTATNAVPNKICAVIEIGSINPKMRVFARRPL